MELFDPLTKQAKQFILWQLGNKIKKTAPCGNVNHSKRTAPTNARCLFGGLFAFASLQPSLKPHEKSQHYRKQHVKNMFWLRLIHVLIYFVTQEKQKTRGHPHSRLHQDTNIASWVANLTKVNSTINLPCPNAEHILVLPCFILQSKALSCRSTTSHQVFFLLDLIVV